MYVVIIIVHADGKIAFCREKSGLINYNSMCIYIKQQTLKNTSDTRLVATVVLLHNRGWGSWVGSIWDGTSLSDREQSPPGEVRPRNALRTSL